MKLKDLIDVPKLQQLTDRLYAASGIPSSIIASDGEILTGSGWQRICTDFHRRHPETERDCIESDVALERQQADGQPFAMYTCPRGLTDASIPITIDGEEVGKAFAGQLFLAPPTQETEASFRAQARRFGFDEDGYLAAFREIPVMPVEKFRAALYFLAELAQLVAELGLQRKREIEQARLLEITSRLSSDYAYAHRLRDDGSLEPVWSVGAFESVSGYTPEELYAQGGWSALIHPDDLERATSYVAALLAGRSASVDLRIRTKSGESRWIRDNGRPWFDEGSGAVVGTFGSARDVTEQKRAEEDLARSEAKFRTAFENAPLLASITALEDGRFLDVNDVFVRSTGYAREVALGRTSVEIGFLGAADRERLVGELREHGAIRNAEVPLRRADGSVMYCLYSGVLIEVGGERRLFSIAADITERKRAEDELRASRTFLETVSDIAYIADREGNVEWVNAAIESATGLSPDDVIGRPFLPLFRASDHPSLIDVYQRTLQGESLENTLTFLAGATCQFTSLPKRDESGEIVGTFGIARDITERLAAERELVASEGRYRSLVENIDVAVALCEVVTDDRGQVVDFVFLDCNPTYERLMHLRGEDVVGRRGLEVIPDLEPKWLDLCGRVALTRQPETVTERSGSLGRYWEVRAYSPAERQFAVAFADVTEREDSAHKLEQSDRRWREAQTVASIGNWEFDVATGQIWASEEAFRIYGVPLDLAQNPELLLPLDEVEACIPERRRVNQALADLIAHDAPYDFEYEVIRRDNGRSQVIHSQASVERRPDGTPVKVTGTIHDVTERRRLEQQLRQAQKLESIGRLAGGVAHDFNNLLTSITGNVELALAEVDADAPQRQLLEEVAHAAGSAAELTRQLLAFSRKQIISPRVLDLNALVDKARWMLARLIGEDIHISTKLSKGPARVRVDATQIEQVLINLAVNARDAMPQGGRLVLATDTISIGDPSHDAELKPGEYVTLSVSDDGCGMDEATRERVFEPFFTTKSVEKGTGLGLATVYGVAKQHGGHIDVESSPGEGARFTIYFPVPGGADTGKAGRVRSGRSAGGAECVLLVEDEVAVRRVAARILVRQGYDVHCAEDGASALALCEENQLQPDLLVTDVVMPHMNGRDLAETLRARRPELRILFTSGYSDEVIAHHGVLDEGVDFLSKPYSAQSLRLRVREALDRPPAR